MNDQKTKNEMRTMELLLRGAVSELSAESQAAVQALADKLVEDMNKPDGHITLLAVNLAMSRYAQAQG